MKRFFQLVLLGLVLVVVALMSALTAMRLAIHGRQVKVPKLVGLTPAQAQKSAASFGLPLELESRFYSSDVPEGRILSQLPPAGTLVRRGWRVRVAESLGPQRAVIPDVTGESQRAAEINIRRRGLDVGTVAVARIPGATSGQVVAQSPPPNAQGIASPKISLLLSAPQEPALYVMPNFVGGRLLDASKAVQDGGFRLGVVNNIPDTGLAPGTILKQSPAPGQRIAAGSSISFDVAM